MALDGCSAYQGLLWSPVGCPVATIATDRAAHADSERRRYYELTPNGRAVALAELARLQILVHRVAGHLAGGAPA